jgi:cell division septation protein DedD
VAETGRRLLLSLLGAASVSVTPRLTAQTQNIDSITVVRTDDALARIRRYAGTDVAAARVLADSLVSALPAGSRLLPDALFAKASIAASAAEAERDYGRIVTEHRFAARVPDALMRLALLESARNNRTSALKHLDRLLRDHADAPARARASLLAGRLRMEANDPARGCELLAAAYASANAAERDVKDQAEQLGAGCPQAVSVLAATDPPPMGVKRAPRDVTPAPAPPAPPRRARRDSTPTVLRTVTPPPTPSPTPSPATPPTTSAPAARDTAAVAPRGERFAVQFAAYNDRPGAEQFASTLRDSGIAARVEGSAAPFRVRAGRYTTRAEAEAAAALWRRPGQPAIVVSLGGPP